MASNDLYARAVANLEDIERERSITVIGLQIYLKASYEICAKIMERLEDEGFISKWDTNKPRKILKTK